MESEVKLIAGYIATPIFITQSLVFKVTPTFETLISAPFYRECHPGQDDILVLDADGRIIYERVGSDDPALQEGKMRKLADGQHPYERYKLYLVSGAERGSKKIEGLIILKKEDTLIKLHPSAGPREIYFYKIKRKGR